MSAYSEERARGGGYLCAVLKYKSTTTTTPLQPTNPHPPVLYHVRTGPSPLARKLLLFLAAAAAAAESV